MNDKPEIKTADKKLAHIEHQNEVIIKSLEEMKLILMNQNKHEEITNNLTDEDFINAQETEAINYINSVVIPRGEEQSKKIGTQGLWQEIVYNFLKTKTLTFVGKALEELKIKGIVWTVDLACFLLERLQDFLYSQYLNASQEQKEVFEDKIFQNFPESSLAVKLKNTCN